MVMYNMSQHRQLSSHENTRWRVLTAKHQSNDTKPDNKYTCQNYMLFQTSAAYATAVTSFVILSMVVKRATRTCQSNIRGPIS